MRAPLVLVATLFAAGAAVPPSQMPPLPRPPPTTPVVVDDVPMTPPEGDPRYSEQTEATVEWLEAVEAARLAARAEDPPVLQASGPPRADGIQHCIGADGTVVFTDRGCAELGATDAPPPGTADDAVAHFAPKSCARTRSALVDGVRDALDARDENRFASYYHWTGMGTRSAYDLMDRLHGFVERPLVDVQLARSEPRDDPYARDGAVPPLWSPLMPPPPPPRQRAPDLVRVDQMRGNKDVAAEVTFFHLTANAGCWWIRF